MNLDQLTDAVLQRMTEQKPRALLIGGEPEINYNYNYVNTKPYDAVILGVLPPGKLLHMPDDTVCEALLSGIPVYFWPKQPFRNALHGRCLCRQLAAAEQRLRQLGVQPLSQAGKLITAQEARRLRSMGLQPSADCRMTPLARDIMEGKAL